MPDIQEILNERQKTHGDFIIHSANSQSLKQVMMRSNGWHKLSQSQREALDMICHKIARILSGNPNHIDHWKDIEGYAALVSTKLEEGDGTI